MSKKSVEKKAPTQVAQDIPDEPEKNIKIKPPKGVKSKRKKRIIIAIVIVLLLAALGGGGAALYFLVINPPKDEAPEQKEPEKEPEAPKIYSKFTGLEISSESENNLPLYCVQIPNGADGARPQTGLTEAGVVFEAIAEAGITRFAAIFQNPQSKAIGPIRSLRSYYLDWDTPFDCAIVHAGGSADAIAAVSSGGYHDLTESVVYMWRDYTSYWAPNNLMTSPSLLAKFATDDGYTSANPQTFLRLTPKEATQLAADAKAAATPAETTSESENAENSTETKPVVPLVETIEVNFGTTPTFNTVYRYDSATNTYPRSYASGEEHLVYDCASSEKTEPSPKSDCGIAKQVSPSAIAVMMVDERLDSEGYHHVIQTIGTGVAYIFQNGTAVKGTWKKTAKNSQIIFTDEQGNVMAFTPGQLWIAAIPNYGGSVKY